MKRTLLIVLGTIGMAGVASVQAQLINVDFNQNNAVALGWGGGGVDPGPTMTGTAVLGSLAADQWNGINVNNGAGISLFDSTGAVTPVSMTFTSGGGFALPEPNWGGNVTPYAGGPWNNLMCDFLYTGPTVVTLSGLAPSQAYQWVLYSAANNAGRITDFTVNGNTLTSTYDNATTTLVEGVSYVNYGSVMSDGSGVLSVTVTAGVGATEGNLNGFQIQAVPEPGTFALVSAGAALLLGYQRRKALRA